MWYFYLIDESDTRIHMLGYIAFPYWVFEGEYSKGLYRKLDIFLKMYIVAMKPFNRRVEKVTMKNNFVEGLLKGIISFTMGDKEF